MSHALDQRLDPVSHRDTVLALAALASLSGAGTDAEELGAGLYHAARRLIERDCADPDLTPELVARKLGCSRASLYRAFLRQDESVAATIAATRLDCAWRMLVSISHLGLLVSEIAFHSGFVDQSSFSRMFKRRYGMSPRQARDEAKLPG